MACTVHARWTSWTGGVPLGPPSWRSCVRVRGRSSAIVLCAILPQQLIDAGLQHFGRDLIGGLGGADQDAVRERAPLPATGRGIIQRRATGPTIFTPHRPAHIVRALSPCRGPVQLIPARAVPAAGRRAGLCTRGDALHHCCRPKCQRGSAPVYGTGRRPAGLGAGTRAGARGRLRMGGCDRVTTATADCRA